MAQVEAWLWDRLNTDADVVAAIGADKVWPIIAPKGTDDPFVTFRRASTDRKYTTRKQDGLPKATFDITCFDHRYARLKVWTDIVRQLVDGFQGSPTGFEIRRAFVVDEYDDPEPVPAGAELPLLFATRLVLEVVHTEEVTQYTI